MARLSHVVWICLDNKLVGRVLYDAQRFTLGLHVIVFFQYQRFLSGACLDFFWEAFLCHTLDFICKSLGRCLGHAVELTRDEENNHTNWISFEGLLSFMVWGLTRVLKEHLCREQHAAGLTSVGIERMMQNMLTADKLISASTRTKTALKSKTHHKQPRPCSLPHGGTSKTQSSC